MSMTFGVPDANGATDLELVITAARAQGNWTLIAPDGRTWFKQELLTLFAVIAGEMRGEPNPFEKL